MKDGRLQVSDLMAGDWVRSKKWAEKPFKLTSLNANLRYYYGITSNGVLVGPFLIEELEPIILTPEILEKTGFKLDKEDGWWWLSPEIGITFWEEGNIELEFWNKHSSANIHINYLHELQHALILCGSDKKIEL